MSDEESAQAIVRRYHHDTAHRLNQYARGPQALDWDQQPNPFRRFQGAALIDLPLVTEEPSASWSELCGDAVPIHQAKLTSLAQLLQLSMGLSAWKVYGPDRWAVRNNPSSGNLHPTETYLVCQNIDDIDDGVYHYAPEHHQLEQRSPGPRWSDDKPRLLIGFSSIAWREAWKYGERAYRYVQLDVGHAIGALRYSAALLGWNINLLGVSDAEIAALLGLDRAEDFTGAENEWPDCLIEITFAEAEASRQAPKAPAEAPWFGVANALGGKPHLQWPIIDEIHQATRSTLPPSFSQSAKRVVTASDNSAPAATLIQRRRSAQAFNPKRSADLPELMPLLTSLAQPGTLPTDVWPLPSRIHPIIYAHRITGLRPGVYALPRSSTGEMLMRQELRDEFVWEPVTAVGDTLPLFGLVYANAQNAARTLSCHQHIASDSVFAVSLLAEFDSAIEEAAFNYRTLHWEAGLIGQQLYLEAEAAGLQGTGIGCFFDESVHETLGIGGSALRVVYHFTVGEAVVDGRILSELGYG